LRDPKADRATNALPIILMLQDSDAVIELDQTSDNDMSAKELRRPAAIRRQNTYCRSASGQAQALT
jgi:hypothetical protein